jgi:hypothetical protein
MTLFRAVKLFGCHFKQIGSFRDKEDPLTFHKLGGFISRKDGHMGGSLYITHGTYF